MPTVHAIGFGQSMNADQTTHGDSRASLRNARCIGLSSPHQEATFVRVGAPRSRQADGRDARCPEQASKME